MPVPLDPQYQFIWDELERDTEPVVRAAFNMNRYQGKKRGLVKLWLDWKDQARVELAERRRDDLDRADRRWDDIKQNAMIIAAVAAIIIALIAWLYPRSAPDSNPVAPKVESHPKSAQP